MSIGVQRGSFAAVPTPLNEQGEIDGNALSRIIENILAGGCSGVLVLGSSGEVTALPLEARRKVIETAVSAVNGKASVLAGIASPSLYGARAELEVMHEYPLDAVVVTPPYYGPVDQDTVSRFYRSLAEYSRVPIIGYHIPAFTGVRIEVDTARALALDGVLAGVKDSNRDQEYFQQIARIRHDTDRPWSAFVGTDSLLLPALMAGATGGITLSASITPAWTAGLVAAFDSADFPEAIRLQEKLTAVILAIRRGAFPAGAKAALQHLGLSGRTLAAPAIGLSEQEAHALGVVLDGLGVSREAGGPR